MWVYWGLPQVSSLFIIYRKQLNIRRYTLIKKNTNRNWLEETIFCCVQWPKQPMGFRVGHCYETTWKKVTFYISQETGTLFFSWNGLHDNIEAQSSLKACLYQVRAKCSPHINLFSQRTTGNWLLYAPDKLHCMSSHFPGANPTYMWTHFSWT